MEEVEFWAKPCKINDEPHLGHMSCPASLYHDQKNERRYEAAELSWSFVGWLQRSCPSHLIESNRPTAHQPCKNQPTAFKEDGTVLRSAPTDGTMPPLDQVKHRNVLMTSHDEDSAHSSIIVLACKII